MEKLLVYECRFRSAFANHLKPKQGDNSECQRVLEFLVALGVLIETGNLKDLEYYYKFALPQDVKISMLEATSSSSSEERLRFQIKRSNTFHRDLFSLIDAKFDTKSLGRLLGTMMKNYVTNGISFIQNRQQSETVTYDDNVQSLILSELVNTNRLLHELVAGSITFSKQDSDESPNEDTDDIGLAAESLEANREEVDKPMQDIDGFDFDSLTVGMNV